jgi:hypothetical protein
VCSFGTAHFHLGVYYDISGNGDYVLVDPYGFNHSKPDPWEQLKQARSVWLWDEFTAPHISGKAGIPTLLTSGGATINIGESSLRVDTDLFLAPAPEQGLASSTSQQSTLVTSGFSSTVGVGSSYLLTGTLATGRQLSKFDSPITLTLAYAAEDINYIDSDTLAVYQWKDDSTGWLILPSTIEKTNKRVIASSDSPGTFMLRAAAINPAPEILSVTPNWSTTSETQTLTINGQNFLSTPTIRLGFTQLTVNFVSSTQLTAILYPYSDAGAYPLIIRNPDGQIVQSAVKFVIPHSVYVPIVAR